MTSYSDLYQEFLSDLEGDNPDSPTAEEVPASYEQIGFIHSLMESTAINALPEREVQQIQYWLSGGITYADASKLINRILEAQPDEPPIHSQKALAKWLREKKLCA